MFWQTLTTVTKTKTDYESGQQRVSCATCEFLSALQTSLAVAALKPFGLHQNWLHLDSANSHLKGNNVLQSGAKNVEVPCFQYARPRGMHAGRCETQAR